MAVFTGYCYQRGSCSHSETKKTSYRRARDELGLARESVRICLVSKPLRWEDMLIVAIGNAFPECGESQNVEEAENSIGCG
jgi:hypothetical protein